MVVLISQRGLFPNCVALLVCLNANALTSGKLNDQWLIKKFLVLKCKPIERNGKFLIYSLKNAMKPYSQMVPRIRKDRLLAYNNRVRTTADSISVLREWNLDLDSRLVDVEGHKLQPEKLLFENGKEHTYVFF